MMPYFDSKNQDNEIVLTPIIYSYHKEKRGIVNWRPSILMRHGSSQANINLHDVHRESS
jgi:hypothetical protein